MADPVPPLQTSPKEATPIPERVPRIFDDLASVIAKQTQIEQFLPTVSLIKQKLKKKRMVSKQVISEKIKELHFLIDKWEQRFIDTAQETMDEKIDKLTKQEKNLKALNKKMNTLIQDAEKLGKTEITVRDREEDSEISISQSFEEEAEHAEVRHLLEELAKIQFPLKPNGVNMSEIDIDINTEFGELLDEAQKSLKRNLTFVGAVVRGYLRRGHKNDKWIKMIRSLESRFEAETNQMDLKPPQVTTNYDTPKHVSSSSKVWETVADLYKYIENSSLRGTPLLSRGAPPIFPQAYMLGELVKQLHSDYKAFPSEVEFYLPQLINLTIHHKDCPEIEDWLLHTCKDSQHFAIQTYFLSNAMGDHGAKRWQRRHRKFRKKLEDAIPREDEKNGAPSKPTTPVAVPTPVAAPATATATAAPATPIPPTAVAATVTISVPQAKRNQTVKMANSGEFSSTAQSQKARREGKAYFFNQVHFMTELVQISNRLTQKFSQPEAFKPELRRELELLQAQYVDTGYAYIPHNMDHLYRCIMILYEECFPIPTYGRVLFWLTVEVVSVPNALTRETVDELLALRTDTPEESEASADTSNAVPAVRQSPTGTFGEPWPLKHARLKRGSPHGHLESWDVRSFVVKHGDCVLQEQFTMQLVRQFQNILAIEAPGTSLHFTTYQIMALSQDSGLIEVVPNAKSLDGVKKVSLDCTSLLGFFQKEWPDKEDFERARRNFVGSLAAYSILCYLLQIKDRHNGNIMLDSDGFILHIDFGYIFGRTMKFEKAPFKLTDEWVELMGGTKSKLFQKYVDRMGDAFIAVRKHYEKILLLVEMTLTKSSMEEQFLPCLEKDSVMKNLRKRFRLEWTEAQIRELVMNLVCEARENWRTAVYDTYQLIVNNIQ